MIRTPVRRCVLINGGASPNHLYDQIGRRIMWNALDWLIVVAPGDNQFQAVPRLLDRYPPGQVFWADLTTQNNLLSCT